MFKNDLNYSTIVGTIFLISVLIYGLFFFREYQYITLEEKSFIMLHSTMSFLIITIGIVSSIGIIAQKKWGQKLSFFTLFLTFLYMVYSIINYSILYDDSKEGIFMVILQILIGISILGFLYLLLLNEHLKKELAVNTIISEDG